MGKGLKEEEKHQGSTALLEPGTLQGGCNAICQLYCAMLRGRALGPFPACLPQKCTSLGKQPPGLGHVGYTSHPQLVGLGEDNLEDWHESRGLAEVAGADDVCVDVQSLLVVAGLDALHDVVQATNDGRRELQGRQARQVSTKERKGTRKGKERKGMRKGTRKRSSECGAWLSGRCGT